MKLFAVAALVATLVGGAAQATTFLTATFDVTVYNYKATGNENQRRANSFATQTVLDRLIAGTIASTKETFTYTGALDFRVGQPQNATQTIANWLGTAGPSVITGLDPAFAARQLSESSYRTTSFFVFTAKNLSAFTASIKHDDGITVFDDGVVSAASAAPTSELPNPTIANFNGGTWSIFYVAANGNPSVLEVAVDRQPSQVPVPAALPLLAVGLGAFAFLRRRAARA